MKTAIVVVLFLVMLASGVNAFLYLYDKKAEDIKIIETCDSN